MAAKKLTMGADLPNPTPEVLKEREQEIRDTIGKYCKSLVQAMSDARATEKPTLGIHQDAFAANYDPDELMLLGMAVKYAGMFGVTLVITGQNRSTLPGVPT